MSDNNNERYRTTLEHLPLEIFLQIFSYFSFSELIQTFFRLNSSIDAAIHSIKSGSQVVRFYDIKSIHRLYSFAINIIRLVINDSSIDLTPFRNLRSLTLKYGSQTQLDSIRPEHLPLLEILCIKSNPRNERIFYRF